MLTTLAHITGIDNPSGRWYLFWSGFGGRVTFLGFAAAVWHRHNCHAPGCPRIGKHVVNGTPWCSRHHPTSEEL